MGIKERILSYLLRYGKENKFRMAKDLKVKVYEVTKALSILEEEGRIEMKEGKVKLTGRNKPLAKEKKIKKEKREEKIEDVKEKIEEELEKELPVEEPLAEESEKEEEKPEKEEELSEDEETRETD